MTHDTDQTDTRDKTPSEPAGLVEPTLDELEAAHETLDELEVTDRTLDHLEREDA